MKADRKAPLPKGTPVWIVGHGIVNEAKAGEAVILEPFGSDDRERFIGYRMQVWEDSTVTGFVHAGDVYRRPEDRAALVARLRADARYLRMDADELEGEGEELPDEA